MTQAKYKKWITKEGLIKIGGWARDGLTDKQIAHNMGIGTSTLYKWKKQHVEIVETLKKEKEVADYQVENSLFQRACGVTIVEKTYQMVDVKKDVLENRRTKFKNIYKLDHPKATQEEIEQEAIEKVPTRERIQTAEYVKQLPPDTNAATFWLRNRKPDKYRDQNFAALNKANTIKANADAKKAKAEARISEYNANQLENSQTYNPLISELYELIKENEGHYDETDN